MAEINRTAKAKINLALHVTGQRDDGYHLLDSLVVFAEVGDQLSFRPAETTSLTISGPFGEGLTSDEDNLILKAARMLGNQGADIYLEKNLPVASGIGGGSADAAAACLGLADLWKGPELKLDELMRLGADVPVCYAARPTRMSGIGDKLTPISFLPDLHAVLVNPMQAVSTVEVFSRLARKSNAPLPDLPLKQLDFKHTVQFLANCRNDLQTSAVQLVPEIETCIQALNSTGAELARMSGSGATCFGLFETARAAESAAKRIVQDFPEWWCVPTLFQGKA